MSQLLNSMSGTAPQYGLGEGPIEHGPTSPPQYGPGEGPVEHMPASDSGGSLVSPDSTFGGILGGISKVASNPFLLSALKGYAGALSAPRGTGPITRGAIGLSSGLEDYYVGEPYRQAQMKKIGAETEKERAAAEEAKTKAGVLKKIPQDEQEAALFPGVARMKAEEKKQQGKQQAAQALIPYYQANASALQGKNPIMAGIYSQAADALKAGADPKEVAGSVRLGQQGQHNEAIEGLRKQQMDQQAAEHRETIDVEQQGLNLRGKELKVQQDREGREALQAKTTQDQAADRLDMAHDREKRQAIVAAGNLADKDRKAEPWYERVYGGKSAADLQKEYMQQFGVAPSPQAPAAPAPAAPRAVPQFKITSGPHKGEVVTLDILQQRKAQDPSYGGVTADPL